MAPGGGGGKFRGKKSRAACIRQGGCKRSGTCGRACRAIPRPPPFRNRSRPGADPALSPAVPYAPRGNSRSIRRANSAEPYGIAASLKSYFALCRAALSPLPTFR